MLQLFRTQVSSCVLEVKQSLCCASRPWLGSWSSWAAFQMNSMNLGVVVMPNTTAPLCDIKQMKSLFAIICVTIYRQLKCKRKCHDYDSPTCNTKVRNSGGHSNVASRSCLSDTQLEWKHCGFFLQFPPSVCWTCLLKTISYHINFISS